MFRRMLETATSYPTAQPTPSNPTPCWAATGCWIDGVLGLPSGYGVLSAPCCLYGNHLCGVARKEAGTLSLPLAALFLTLVFTSTHMHERHSFRRCFAAGAAGTEGPKAADGAPRLSAALFLNAAAVLLRVLRGVQLIGKMDGAVRLLSSGVRRRLFAWVCYRAGAGEQRKDAFGTYIKRALCESRKMARPLPKNKRCLKMLGR